MQPLSVSVTTFNSERTLDACLRSVEWADEIVVLDSLSTDGTLEIAGRYGCRVFRQEFLGYARQKQLALDRATHRWTLLLDSDEALSPALEREIRDLLRRGPDAEGYRIPRVEQMYWRMAGRGTRSTRLLRLFDRTRTRISEREIHEAPVVDGRVRSLRHPLYHFNNTDLRLRVERANRHSSASVSDKLARGARGNPWMTVVYPPFYFVRQYVLQRQFLNGWAGFFGSAISAFYVFLKYAKLYEHFQVERHGDRLLPEGAPKRARKGARETA